MAQSFKLHKVGRDLNALFLGPAHTGKTTRAIDYALGPTTENGKRRQTERIIILDPCMTVEADDFTYASTKRDILNGMSSGEFRMVYQHKAEVMPYSDAILLIVQWCERAKLRTTIVVDEVGQMLKDSKDKGTAFLQGVRTGAHFGLSTLGVSQRIFDIETAPRENFELAYITGCNNRTDVQNYNALGMEDDSTGKRLGDVCKNLAQYRAVRYHINSGRWSEVGPGAK